MGERENRRLLERMDELGWPVRDRRLAASEEYFTRGDPSLPNPSPGRSRARHIYGQSTPAGSVSRRWQRQDIRRRRDIEGGGRTRRRPAAVVSPIGPRTLAEIRGIILHQTRFNIPALPATPQPVPSDAADRTRYIRRNDHRVDVIIAHFVVLRSGAIAYTHDVTHRLNSVSYHAGIDIEFEGRYPYDETPPTNPQQRITVAAIRAGLALVRALYEVFHIECIATHGQIQENPGKINLCPGPDIWVNVGMRSARELPISTNSTAVFGRDNGFGMQENTAYKRVLVG
jgi:hypothetical protein